MANVTVKIDGARELQERFRRLGGPLLDRTGFAAVRAGGAVIRDEAKALAPVLKKPDPRRNPGTLKKSIRVARARPEAGSADYEVIVGVRKLSKGAIRKFKRQAGTFASFKSRGRILGGADNPNDPYYWRWVEFQTARKGLRAQPFMAPGFTAGRERASDAIIGKLRKLLDKAGQ